MDVMEFVVKVQQIAKVGLMYSNDPFAVENYKMLEVLSREFLNEKWVAPPIDKNLFERDIYPTPNSSVRVLVFNEDNEILMVREVDDGGWSVPGGWCEIYLGLTENASKEVKEESGVDVSIGRLLAIFRREIYKDQPSLVSEYVHYFTAKALTDDLSSNHETLDVRYFPMNELPPLSRKNSLKELSIAMEVYLKHRDPYID